TRDVLRERVDLDGIVVTLVDTAGLRESGDVVEREGMRRARAELALADIAILVTRAGHEQQDRELLADCNAAATRVIVHNNIDLDAAMVQVERRSEREIQIRLSAQTGAGIAELRNELLRLGGRDGGGAGTFSARRRHVEALERVVARLAAADAALRDQRAGEL